MIQFLTEIKSATQIANKSGFALSEKKNPKKTLVSTTEQQRKCPGRSKQSVAKVSNNAPMRETETDYIV